MRLGARNQLTGTVTSIKLGEAIAYVVLGAALPRVSAPTFASR
jgi:molybdopterin-binding protein